MGREKLTLMNGVDGQQIGFQPRHLILGGYTGRDREHVQRHIDELVAAGIPAPASVPELYPGHAAAIQIGGVLPAGSGWSSGEVEYVLFVTAQGVYVGVGSDHTDRALERTSIVAAKQAFPKVVGSHVWPITHLASDWDALILRSWITQGGERRLHQEGVLATVILPQALLNLISADARGNGLVVFSGTVPATEPAPSNGLCRFEGELLGPRGQVLTACSYEYAASPPSLPSP